MADGDVDHDSTPPLRLRPHKADHGDSRLGVIKRGVGRTGCLLLTSLMSRNYNIEARDKFPLPPCPDELDYPSVRELKVAKAAYSVARCRRDNSTVPGLPIQRSYGTHSHTTFPTLDSILFWPVKAVGNRITIGICNMSRTPPINHKSFQITR